ncbi:MAG TPA: Ig domain-containing protein [Acidimicrobiales bacterium]
MTFELARAAKRTRVWVTRAPKIVAAALVILAVVNVPVVHTASAASSGYHDSYTGTKFCTSYGGRVGPQLVINNVDTNIYECGGDVKDLSAQASPYTTGDTPFDENGGGYDPHGSFQCVELSLRFEYIVYGKDTLFNATGHNLPGGAGTNVVNYLYSQFGIPVAFGVGNVAKPPRSAPAPSAGNILSFGPERSDEPTGHTAVIEKVSGDAATRNYTVTIISENAPTQATIKVVNGVWPTLWGYNQYNWTLQSGGDPGAPLLTITTQSTSTSPPNATVGNPYSFQLSAGGIPGPYTWSLVSGKLPPGLSLSTSGLISGTPTSASRLGAFIVEVVDGKQSDEAPFTIWALKGKKKTTPAVSSSCWGRCGGPEGPIGGAFVVSGTTIQEFQDTQACLGDDSNGFTYYLLIEKPIPISSKGAFSYSGPAAVSNGTGSTGTRLWATVEGQFTSSTRASVTLEVLYKQCGTYHLTLNEVPDSAS